ncbi:unnamed protein product [Cuscuta campestris]|uniref:Uncharacterized protein n=1 Tax=Cuscuta campestris TaxID=132261 RepID=A0A484KNC6_9ASTE|nr:unnamed protein product [Cuscuta campestris]
MEASDSLQMTLHNYIRRHAGSKDYDFSEFEDKDDEFEEDSDDEESCSSHRRGSNESAMNSLKDKIADNLLRYRVNL